MNKAELIGALAQHYEGSRADATKALNAVVQTITYSAAAGEKVAITGFGVFEKIDRPARIVRNPRTGERKEAAATSVPRFRAGTELKAYVSGERALPEAADSTTTRAPASRAPSAAPASAPAPAETQPAKSGTAAKKKDSKKDAKKAEPAKKLESAKKGKSAKKKDGKKSKSGK